jgi:DNA-binding response OmpR family regulator
VTDTPMKILLVEDDEATAKALRAFLHHQIPSDIELVESLAEARDAINRRRYDCILLDLMLLGGRGEELLEETKDRPDRPRVIVVTAIPEDGARWNRVKALGPDAMVRKPYDPDDLVAAIRGVVPGPDRPPQP